MDMWEKTDPANGDIIRYEAQLVARGFYQADGTVNKETLAPMAKSTHIDNIHVHLI